MLLASGLVDAPGSPSSCSFSNMHFSSHPDQIHPGSIPRLALHLYFQLSGGHHPPRCPICAPYLLSIRSPVFAKSFVVLKVLYPRCFTRASLPSNAASFILFPQPDSWLCFLLNEAPVSRSKMGMSILASQRPCEHWTREGTTGQAHCLPSSLKAGSKFGLVLFCFSLTAKGIAPTIMERTNSKH